MSQITKEIDTFDSGALLRLAILMTISPVVTAELALNFQPSATPLNVLISCMPGVSYSSSSCVRKGSFADPDTTPFYMETVVDGSFGYYHILLGDPASDFAQEYYIAFAGASSWLGYSGFRYNASAGSFNGGADAAHNGVVTYYDPLDSDPLKSGNATGNPTKSTFNQTIKGTGFQQNIEKPLYLKQPWITQQTSDAELVGDFSIDMRANSYTVMSATPGVIANTMHITDAQTGLIVADFDMATSSQNSYVSGGRVTYTNGTESGASNGSYTYVTGIFDARTTDWRALWDITVNVP